MRRSAFRAIIDLHRIKNIILALHNNTLGGTYSISQGVESVATVIRLCQWNAHPFKPFVHLAQRIISSEDFSARNNVQCGGLAKVGYQSPHIKRLALRAVRYCQWRTIHIQNRHIRPLLRYKIVTQILPLPVGDNGVRYTRQSNSYSDTPLPWLPDPNSHPPPWGAIVSMGLGLLGSICGAIVGKRCLPWSGLAMVIGVILWTCRAWVVLPWSVSYELMKLIGEFLEPVRDCPRPIIHAKVSASDPPPSDYRPVAMPLSWLLPAHPVPSLVPPGVFSSRL